MPGAGSPRVGELCGIPGLRVRRIAGFPCGWFYFVTPDHVDIVRLLADAQDLPAIFADPPAEFDRPAIDPHRPTRRATASPCRARRAEVRIESDPYRAPSRQLDVSRHGPVWV